VNAQTDLIALIRELIRCPSITPAHEAAFDLASAPTHKADKRVPVCDIRTLTDIYTDVLDGCFVDRRIR
jgi:hypothetical protein